MQRKMAIGLVVLTILGAIGIVLIKERAVANRRMHISLSTISKHRVVMKKVAVKQAGGISTNSYQ